MFYMIKHCMSFWCDGKVHIGVTLLEVVDVIDEIRIENLAETRFYNQLKVLHEESAISRIL